MKKISFITLSLLISCSSKPNLSCDSKNLDKLAQVSRSFIMQQTSSDAKAAAITFDDFQIKKTSCKFLKRQKRVDYSLNANGTQGSKTKKLIFNCSYGNIGKKKNSDDMDANCRLVSIR